ncbi:uncharacterized protein DUF3501 [Plasticicumulans lactativorans]|uniref:Uncharacterized protein DUF3501 n=1 Tax=Plasticicumulans lactativorans TaxID=1133106 RepID=A0A4R2L7V0_9GAMM|nr:DUF3501 family protein [Plasticicumulans lactativorans]TCO81417.1 uncharacterized protein DUF3501 [Plasticicumulans lactativorans]
MKPLTRADLFSLERYAELRPEFRARVLAHKKARQVAVGPHATLYFEDRLTIQYQVQEMLRIERIFEAGGIAEELSAYNPLIPDGRNWKATFMLEYPDPEERRQALGRLIGIEDRVWVQAAGCARVWAIADEDLERERADKTASVHFVRFEFDAGTLAALRAGAAVELGIDHDHYRHALRLGEATRTALLADLD